ncbi:MAG: ubiquitin family protein [Planctomycetota bacterium]|jgi:hypothetical protein
MPIIFEIPEELQRYSAGQAEVAIDASTLNAAFAAVFERFPELQPRVLSDDGDFHPWIPVFLNGQKLIARRPGNQSIRDSDRIELAVLASGG